jgi:hypothetical protein
MAFLDVVNSISRKIIVPGLTDQIFKAGPTLAYIKRNCLQKWQGFQMQENFLYGMMNVEPYLPGDSFDISQAQIFTGGTITPRYYNVAVPALLEKVKIEYAGQEAVFNYVDVLMQAAALTMSAKLATDIFEHGQTSSTVVQDRTKVINGLAEALSDGTSTDFRGRTFPSYLTVTRADANFQGATPLNSPMTAAAGTIAANVGGSISYPVLEQGFNSVVYGTETPDLIITTNKGLSYIKMAFQAQQRFEGTSLDFGFQGVKFNSATIFQDRYAPGSAAVSTMEASKLGLAALDGTSSTVAGETLWYLNTKYIRFYVSTDSLYGFGFTGFLPAQDNSVVVGHYKYAGTMTVQAPRLMRVLFGITG